MTAKRLLHISRPRFWIYEIGPYLLGVSAVAAIDYSLLLSPLLLLFLLFFAYPANIFIYGINDIFDYETDKLNPKKQAYEALVTPSEQKTLFRHIFLVCAPFLLAALYLLSPLSLTAFLAFFFFAGFYSATPIRAKSKPFLDSFFSAGHYVATGVFAFLLVGGLVDVSIDYTTLGLCTLAGMAWAMAMHAYSAIPDISADEASGLSTVATLLGQKKTVWLCAILYASAGVIFYLYAGYLSILLTLPYLLLMFASYTANATKLFSLYTYFPILNTVVGMVVTLHLLVF